MEAFVFLPFNPLMFFDSFMFHLMLYTRFLKNPIPSDSFSSKRPVNAALAIILYK